MSFGQLIPLDDDNFKMILPWRNHDSIRMNMYTSHIISQKEHDDWWFSIKGSNDHKCFIYNIDDLPSGYIAFQRDKQTGILSWAFYSNPFIAKKIGPLMEYDAINYAFENFNVDMLYCEVLEFNKTVVKLHQKFGFKLINDVKKKHQHQNNIIDVHFLGLSQKNWFNLKSDILKKLTILRKK